VGEGGGRELVKMLRRRCERKREEVERMGGSITYNKEKKETHYASSIISSTHTHKSTITNRVIHSLSVSYVFN